MDILTKLHEDARRLRVAQQLPQSGKISQQKARAISQEFDAIIDKHGLSLAQVANRLGAGYSSSTLSGWRSACRDSAKREQFRGDFDRICRTVNEWMEAFESASEAPRYEQFVDIRTARLMYQVIRQAHRNRAIGVITGDAGRGKTMTMKYAAEQFPGSVYFRISQFCRTPAAIAKQLARKLGLKHGGTLVNIYTALVEQLAGSERLLLIDEAHQMTHRAREFLRDLHDECEIPLVLGGTRQIEDQVHDPDLFFGQFGRRVVARYDVNEQVRSAPGDPEPTRMIHSLEEMRKVFASERVKFTPDGIVALARIANLEGFGGLGLAKQIVLIAHTVAEREQRAIDGELVLKALHEMHGKARAIHQIEHAMESSRLKIA